VKGEGNEYGRKVEENKRTKRINELRIVCDESTKDNFFRVKINISHALITETCRDILGLLASVYYY
jgi:hypothetical protein